MKAGPLAAIVALLVLASVLALGAPGVASAHSSPLASGTLTGNITGPTVVQVPCQSVLYDQRDRRPRVQRQWNPGREPHLLSRRSRERT